MSRYQPRSLQRIPTQAEVAAMESARTASILARRAADAKAREDAVAEVFDPEPSNCPWCGAYGIGFDESPRPADCCEHDLALVRKEP